MLLSSTEGSLKLLLRLTDRLLSEGVKLALHTCSCPPSGETVRIKDLLKK